MLEDETTERVQDLLADFQSQDDAAHSSLRTIIERETAAQHAMRRAESDHAELMEYDHKGQVIRDHYIEGDEGFSESGREGVRHVVKTRDRDHARIAKSKRAVDSAKRLLAKVTAERIVAEAHWEAAGMTRTRAHYYVLQIPEGADLSLNERNPATPRKNESPEAGVARLRKSIAALKEREQAAIKAPLTSDAAKALAQTQLLNLQLDGRIDCTELLHGGFIRWPHHIPEGSIRSVPNPMALIGNVFFKEILKAVFERIDSQAQDLDALSPENKESQLVVIRGEMFELEADENQIVVAAGLDRRLDIDPRIVLGLKPSLARFVE